jgi:KUP system potassium uptake protein
MTERWGWRPWIALLTTGLFLIVDGAFFVANLLKIADGGWIPLLLGSLLVVLMTTWRKGIGAIRLRAGAEREEPERFLRALLDGAVPRVPGTAVFLTRTTRPVPSIMVRHVADLHALHRLVASLTVEFEEVPRVARADRVRVEKVAEDFWHITAHFGFMEMPDLRAALAAAREHGCLLDLDHAIFFGTYDDVVPAEKGERLLPAWRRWLFSFMYRNAVRAVDRYRLPRDRFVTMGRQLPV